MQWQCSGNAVAMPGEAVLAHYLQRMQAVQREVVVQSSTMGEIAGDL